MLIRLFVADRLATAAALALSRDQAHYLRGVLRRGPGETVFLFNGRDGEWRGRLETLGKTAATVVAEARTRPQGPETDLWLAFAPLKKDATDFVVQKATELGVSRLWPVFTRRTAAGRVNRDRMRAQAIEAAEQCRRLTVPDVAAAVDLDGLIAGWPAGRRLLLADETGTASPFSAVVDGPAAGGDGLLVGPEGGFEASELDALRKLPFVIPVSLGPRILRAETAALVLAAGWQMLAGDGCLSSLRGGPRPCGQPAPDENSGH